MLWEVVFMLVILKIPVAYLGAVVWWAIRAEPRPGEEAAVSVSLEPNRVGPCDWRDRMRRRVRGPRPAGGGSRPVQRVAVLRVGART